MIDKKYNQWLKDEQKKAIDYLVSEDFSYSKGKDLYFKSFLFNSKNIDLKIVIPKSFPLKYPKFYVDDKSWYMKYPHVEKYINQIGSSICYLEDEQKKPIMDGKKIIENELKRIYQIINDYEIDQYEKNDFLDEFDSYWFDGLIYLDLSIDLLDNCLIDLCKYNHFGKVVTDNLELTTNKMTILNYEAIYNEKAMFLPLLKINSFLPNTYNKILDLIELSEYKDFFNKFKNDVNIIVFSFLIEEQIHYGAFELQKLKAKVPRYLPNDELKKLRVLRIDRKKIFTRGGNELTKNISFSSIKIAIVGCGSLGGSLAFKLAKSGIKNFILVDKDIFTFDNLARHICNMKQIGKNKVDALKDTILEHFPDCEIETSSKDVVDSLDLIYSSNLIVSAVGGEGNIFEHFISQIDKLPRIFTWFESDIAGHLIFTEKQTFLFDKILPKIKTVKNEISFTKKEFGCNSVYTPYSFIDAENTVNHVARFISKFVSNPKEVKECALTFFGDIETNRDKLNDDFICYNSYSVLERNLDELVDD